MIEQIKKQFETLGYQTNFSSSSDYRSFGIKKGIYLTQFMLEKKAIHNETYALTVMGKHIRDVKEETMLSLIDFFEQQAKQKKEVMKIDISLFSTCTGIDLEEPLKEKGYVFLDPEEGELLEEIKGEDYEEKRFMLLSSSKKRLKENISYERKMKNFLNARKERSPLFEFRPFDEGFWFIDEGNEGYVFLSKTEEEKNLIWCDKERVTQSVMQICHEREINDLMENYLKKEIQKNRIKHVLNPPDFFYKKFIYCDDMYSDLTEYTEKKLYEELKKCFHPREIEEQCSRYIRKEEIKKRYLPNRCVLLFFGKKAVIIDRKKDDIILFDNNDDCKENVNQYVMKCVEDELNEALKDI